MKKLVFSTLSALALSLTLIGSGASAEENIELTEKDKYYSKEEVVLALELREAGKNLSEVKKDKIAKKILKMSDEEYSRFIHNYVLNNESSAEEMTEELATVGVEFSIDKKEANKSGVGIMVESDPADLTLTVSSSKRGGVSYWTLLSSWDHAGTESGPATIDLVSVEWDPTVGKYYSYGAEGSVTTARDGSKRGSGVYMFNVNDSKTSFDSWVSVNVTKLKSSALEYGTKYTHTYTTSSTSATGSASFNWDTSGPSGGYSYSVTTQTNVVSWDRYDDNTLYW